MTTHETPPLGEEPSAKRQKTAPLNGDHHAASSSSSSSSTDALESYRHTTVPNKPTIYYREREGETSFAVITNDNSERNLIWLISLKEIFAKQLPKMPREYIVRLVMDRNHQSLVCLEKDVVVGGITFRPFLEQRFAEIAFCAVSWSHQVKGYGTKMMNHLKEYVKGVPLNGFLTYADNFAIGYFKKQGFSANISMPRERWFGFIKDYDGGTLMECVVHPLVNYLKVGEMLRMQRDFLLTKILEVRKIDPIYPGLDKLLASSTSTSSSSPGDLSGADVYERVPGLKEAGWRKPVLPSSSSQFLAGNKSSSSSSSSSTEANSSAATRQYSSASRAELQSALMSVVNQVTAHRESWPFLEPVPPTVVDYLDVIAEPVDLSLIRSRVRAGDYYHSPADLRRDLELMVRNCMTYNAKETSYYRAAATLQALFPSLFGDDRRVAEVAAASSSSSTNGTSTTATTTTTTPPASATDNVNKTG